MPSVRGRVWPGLPVILKHNQDFPNSSEPWYAKPALCECSWYMNLMCGLHACMTKGPEVAALNPHYWCCGCNQMLTYKSLEATCGIVISHTNNSDAVITHIYKIGQPAHLFQTRAKLCLYCLDVFAIKNSYGPASLLCNLAPGTKLARWSGPRGIGAVRSRKLWKARK